MEFYLELKKPWRSWFAALKVNLQNHCIVVQFGILPQACRAKLCLVYVLILIKTPSQDLGKFWGHNLMCSRLHRSIVEVQKESTLQSVASLYVPHNVPVWPWIWLERTHRSLVGCGSRRRRRAEGPRSWDLLAPRGCNPTWYSGAHTASGWPHAGESAGQARRHRHSLAHLYAERSPHDGSWTEKDAGWTGPAALADPRPKLARTGLTTREKPNRRERPAVAQQRGWDRCCWRSRRRAENFEGHVEAVIAPRNKFASIKERQK